MQALSPRRATVLLALILVLSAATVACAPNPSVGVLSPELGEKLVAQAANAEVEVVPTPEPLGIADLTEEQITAGLPADFAAALAQAQPENGEKLAVANGCVGCHSLDPSVQMTGPSWLDAGDHAVNRVPDESPALYLYTSIISPNAFVVEGYPQNIMPQNFSDILSEQDIADLVSYLLSQHE